MSWLIGLIEKILVRPGLLKHCSKEDEKKYLKTISNFLEQRKHGIRLEKLNHAHDQIPLYSIRTNNIVRLILTYIVHEKKQVWLWIGILDNHQYQNYLSKTKTWFDKRIQETLEENLSINSENHPTSLKINSPAIELHEELGIQFHQERYIILDTHQQHLISLAHPMLISGAPGSGKSLAVFSLFKNYAFQTANSYFENDSLSKKRILYLTESPNLCDFMQSEWHKLVAVESIPTEYCDFYFKTPADLHLEHASGEEHIKLVTANNFYDWLEKRIKNTLSLQKKPISRNKEIDSTPKLFLKKILVHPEYVYQEFRTISAYPSFDIYNEQAGSKHSLFIEEEQRQWLFETYISYLNHLKEKKLRDLNFHPLKSTVIYDGLICDETDNLSRMQIASALDLINIKSPTLFLTFIVGDHQRVFDSRSILPYLNSLFYKIGNICINHLQLQYSYRCSKPIIECANAILQIKYHLTQLSFDKCELRFIELPHANDEESHLYWFENPNQLQPLIKDSNNAQFVVITSAIYLKEAQQLFGMERVFIIEEIKGLEYDHVLLYKLLEHEQFEAVNEAIHPQFTLSKENNFLTHYKSPQPSIGFNIELNKLFTAVTRARASVTFYHTTSNNKPLFKLLKEFINKTPETNHIQSVPTQSSTAEWQLRAAQLHKTQHHEQMQTIERKFLQSNPSHTNAAKAIPTQPMMALSEKVSSQDIIQAILQGTDSQIQNILTLQLLLPDVDDFLFQYKSGRCNLQLLMQQERIKRIFIVTILDTLSSAAQRYYLQHNATDFYNLVSLICRTITSFKWNDPNSSILNSILQTPNTDQLSLITLMAKLNKTAVEQFVRTQDSNKLNLIQYAIQSNNEMLLVRINGLLPLKDFKDKKGNSPMHYAHDYKQNQLRCFLSSDEIGCDPNIYNSVTELHTSPLLPYPNTLVHDQVTSKNSVTTTRTHVSIQASKKSILSQPKNNSGIKFTNSKSKNIKLFQAKAEQEATSTCDMFDSNSLQKAIVSYDFELADFFISPFAIDYFFNTQFPSDDLNSTQVNFFNFLINRPALVLMLKEALPILMECLGSDAPQFTKNFIQLLCYTPNKKQWNNEPHSFLVFMLMHNMIDSATLALLKKHAPESTLASSLCQTDDQSLTWIHYLIATNQHQLLFSVGNVIDLDAIDFKTISFVHYAAIKESVSSLLTLKKLKLNFSRTNERGFQVIHTAATLENTLVLKTLICIGVDVNTVCSDGLSPLTIAIINNNCAAIELLHNHDKHLINTYSTHFIYAPIAVALIYYKLEAFKTLVKFGGRLDLKFESHQITLAHLASNMNDETIFDFLLEQEINLNATDSVGNTAAHYLARDGKINTLAHLNSLGVDVNTLNNMGETPADVAIKSHFTQCLYDQFDCSENEYGSVYLQQKEKSSLQSKKSITAQTYPISFFRSELQIPDDLKSISVNALLQPTKECR